ncbi:MAG: tetratricopeptide repeat protein, partial [Actinomycetota bacterium]|nr:tetratricopeptide repeat protein [Actinomycetota bacterium]
MQRWARGALSGLAVVGLAAGLLALGTAAGTPRGQAPAVAPAPADPLTGLQQRLSRRPDDAQGWAELGLGHVQRARLTADPSSYGRAEKAFARSLQVQPRANAAALTGQATLAAARHEFAEALRLADAALAVNPYSATAYGVKTDALVELGRYDAALDAVQRMLDLRPAVDSLTRASYAAELRGRVDRARELLEQAESSASRPSDRAFAAHQLGELAWNKGDLTAARAGYDRALQTDPTFLPALAGRARVLAAQGQTEAALADHREVVQRLPAPQHLVELGTLLEASGQRDAAQDQYDVVRATQQLFAAQGADVDLELALFEADHGDPATALRYASAAYRDRPQAVLVQDAYAWALHRAGRSAEALPVARAALRLGTRLPALQYHLGAIAAAAGDPATARRALGA